MPSSLRDPKTLSDWIELDYYRRRRRLPRLKALLAGLLFLACVAGLAAVAFLPDHPRIYESGPVSNAHAMFNNDCGKCHTEAFEPAKRLWPGNVHLRSVRDDVCLRCHDGPIHKEQQTHQPHCASCHQEHRGRPVLAAVADSHCTACHANLQKKNGQPSRYENVTDFAHSHPEFAIWRAGTGTDHSTLRFNHQVHLQEGGVLGPDRKPVQLQCASCHQSDEAGRYMKPVRFASHCAQCHPLAVQLPGEWQEKSLQQAAARFRAQPAPHEEPARVRAALRERLIQLGQEYPGLLRGDAAGPERPFPGRPVAESSADSQALWVNRQLQDLERVLFQGAGGCRYCHTLTRNPAPQELPEFARTQIPERWLPHSRFRHVAHRMLQCNQCHSAAQSQTNSDVLMPRIADCRQCHNPKVGAQTSCYECHLYHDHGRSESWEGKLRISDCLGQLAPAK